MKLSYKQALFFGVLAVVINSFTSTFLAMIVKAGMDSSVVTFYRMIGVAAVMIPWSLIKKSNRDNMKEAAPKIWKPFVGYTITKLLGFVLWAEGLRMGASAFSMTTLSNMQPIIIVVFLWLLYKEKTSLRSLVGILVCLVGVTVIGIDNVISFGSPFVLIVIIICCCCFALNNIFGRRARQHLDLAPMIGFSYLFAGIMAGVYAAMQGASFAIPAAAIWPLIGVTFGCTLVGQSMSMWVLKYVKNVTMSLIGLLSPFCTAVSAFFMLGEVPEGIVFIGAFIMIAGLVLYQRAESHAKAK
ncbi:MAG: EamA family transporter [Clostridia bacterium]|nr:EamA family transporter [Clostridia bacterium]